MRRLEAVHRRLSVLQVQAVILFGMLRKGGGVKAAVIRYFEPALAPLVDETVAQDRAQMRDQAGGGLKPRAVFPGIEQGELHKIVGLDTVEGRRQGGAPRRGTKSIRSSLKTPAT